MATDRRLELFIADGCNLQCWFCIESVRIAQKRFMPWEEVEHHLLKAVADGVDVVQFMGGEATLHPRFADALALCRELRLRTYVITNLLRWRDRGFAEAVGPRLDEVMISMHAHGADAGHAISGVRSWKATFDEALANARETLTGAIQASTVLTRDNVAELEAIAEQVLSVGPHLWVMGNAVPVEGTRKDAVDGNLTLTELDALRPRFAALAAQARAAGCRLVFFAFPHCVLGPGLWDDTHDHILADQDLSDDAPSAVETVQFWSRADYLDGPGRIHLGRTRPDVCAPCARRAVCGGHFSAYFDRHGTAELRPVA